MDIKKELHEIAQNEHENYRVFRERLVEYCTKEKAVFTVFRVLRNIETQLKDCLDGKVHVGVDKTIVKKVFRAIKTELIILKTKFKRPELLEIIEPKAPPPAGKWTTEKLNLIELIYAIYKTKSVNNGKATLKGIQECFEYVFQVDLGNISKRIDEIDSRKAQDKLYLDMLLASLKQFLDDNNL